MPCYHPLLLKPSIKRPMGLVVPCSRCIGCRLEYSRQWAIRCVHEAQMHEDNCFVTLTYRDADLIYGADRATLYPRHLQLFMKRLRKKYGQGIRFFACGEYGERTVRPHYHACLFGIDFPDRVFYKINANKDRLYSSAILDSLWTHGNCYIGSVTFESAAYVARYIVGKKLGLNSQAPAEQGYCSEFVRMSRRPGIGRPWFNSYSSDVFPSDSVIIRGIRCKPPTYYSSIYELEKPDEMLYIKKRRINESFDRRGDNTLSRLKVKERVKIAQTTSLLRTSN